MPIHVDNLPPGAQQQICFETMGDKHGHGQLQLHVPVSAHGDGEVPSPGKLLAVFFIFGNNFCIYSLFHICCSMYAASRSRAACGGFAHGNVPIILSIYTWMRADCAAGPTPAFQKMTRG